MRTNYRPITVPIAALALSAALGTSAFANGHLESEQQGGEDEVKPKPAKVINILPADHVMLVGGTRRLDAQICNEDGSGCKNAGNKAKWKVKPRKGLALSSRKGTSANATGEKTGTYTVTVNQGGAKGSTTVTINEPPNREPAAAPSMRLVSVPEHPIVAAGHPYAMSFYKCPAGVTAESVVDTGSAGFRPIANAESGVPDLNIRTVEDLLVLAGCDPANLTTLDPDSGFEILHEDGHRLLLYKAEDAEGFAVRVADEDGESLLPSDKAAYFGADAVEESDLPGLEGIDLAAVDREYLAQFGIDDFERFDVNGDNTLSVADILAFRDNQERLAQDDAGEIDLDEDQARVEDALDIDGDGVPDTAADELLLKTALGALMLDLLLLETPGAC